MVRVREANTGDWARRRGVDKGSERACGCCSGMMCEVSMFTASVVSRRGNTACMAGA